MKDHQMHSKEFLIGAALGGILGGIAALLNAPKSGYKLRKDIHDAYCDLSDSTHDLSDQLKKRGRSFAKNFSAHKDDWTDKAHSAVEGVRHWGSHDDEEGHTRDLLIGGLAGGIIGALAGLLLAPKPGEELRHELMDTYHDISDRTHDAADEMTHKGQVFVKKAKKSASKWLDIAKEVVDEFTEDVQDSSEEVVDKAKDFAGHNHLNDVAEWASVGLRLWKRLRR